MKKMYFVLFLALIATACAQMDDDEFEGASDGDGFGGSSEESREVASSDDFVDDDRFGGETQRNTMRFTSDVPFGADREKRSIDNVLEPLIRVRRGKKMAPPGIVGPVFTHVKTDHHGNFKWGVKHKVGGGGGGGHGGHYY